MEHNRRAGDVLAGRKPMLLLRFDGWSLLRLAERQFWALVFQLPPRITRFSEPDATRALLVRFLRP